VHIFDTNLFFCLSLCHVLTTNTDTWPQECFRQLSHWNSDQMTNFLNNLKHIRTNSKTMSTALTITVTDVFILHPLHTHTHTQTFNGPFSKTTRVSWYQKGITNLDFTEARDSEWQWHQLGRMQVCITLQTTTPAPHHSVFYRPDALPAA